jgi:hypothetical protein
MYILTFHDQPLNNSHFWTTATIFEFQGWPLNTGFKNDFWSIFELKSDFRSIFELKSVWLSNLSLTSILVFQVACYFIKVGVTLFSCNVVACANWSWRKNCVGIVRTVQWFVFFCSFANSPIFDFLYFIIAMIELKKSDTREIWSWRKKCVRTIFCTWRKNASGFSQRKVFLFHSFVLFCATKVFFQFHFSLALKLIILLLIIINYTVINYN